MDTEMDMDIDYYWNGELRTVGCIYVKVSIYVIFSILKVVSSEN
jgi:hypothetical protein